MILPKFARAAVVREFGKAITIEDVPIPDTIEPGALLVRIEACSICGTDVHLWEGSLALKVDLPVILGHEMVGRIVKFGDGADKDSLGQQLKIGDRVVWSHTNCNSCYFCTVAKQPTLCINRRGYMYETCENPPYLLGGFAEYSYVVPESGRVRVPDSVSDPVASLSSCAFRSVVNAVDQTGAIRPTDTIVIQGAGPLGLLATAVCKLAGARRVITIGAPEQRLRLAKEFGADEVISIDEIQDPKLRQQEVDHMTNGLGADVVFEFSGHPSAFAEGLELVRKGGRYMVVGQLGSGSVQFQPSMITKKNLTVLGSFSGDISHYWKSLQYVYEYQNRLPFERLISNEYALDDINLALQRMQAFEEIKPVLYPWK